MDNHAEHENPTPEHAAQATVDRLRAWAASPEGLAWGDDVAKVTAAFDEHNDG